MFRIEPAMAPPAYKTYTLRQPLATHWRAVTCAGFGCPAWMHGWVTTVPPDSDQAAWIRGGSGRKFAETRSEDGFAVFTFLPGQDCFASASHRVSLQRPQIYSERSGDWRWNPRDTRILTAADWVDSFANHQDRIKTRIERG